MNTASARSDSYILKRLRHLGLNDPVAHLVARDIRVQSFEAGHTIWAKGGMVQSWQLILHGLVSASIPTVNSDATPISVYGDGSWFGEQSIINRKPSYAAYVCLIPTEVLSMPAERFDQLFLEDAEFARFVAKLVAWRVQKTSETLMLMKLGNPCLRVVMGLAQFAEALSYRSERPPTIGFGDGLEIPIPQSTLASLCGVSRTLFSEYVQELANDEWLKLSYGKMEVLSPLAWHSFAQRQRTLDIGNLAPSMAQLLQELKACDFTRQ
jgi:CRP/FNR family transcriptional regulator, cyclic AMP receptor protein